MEKKLPGVFVNKNQDLSGNNDSVYYSSKNEVTENNDDVRVSNVNKGMNVNQKINAIFNSSSYIYKADVEITLRDEKICKRIVGKNSTHLITFENELIPIADVIDIKKV